MYTQDKAIPSPLLLTAYERPPLHILAYRITGLLTNYANVIGSILKTTIYFFLLINNKEKWSKRIYNHSPLKDDNMSAYKEEAYIGVNHVSNKSRNREKRHAEHFHKT